MDNDPKPDIEPTIFIQELIRTILDQRTSIGLGPDDMCSLDLRYNNAKSFDTSQKAKVSHIANIGVATLLTPIDNNGTVVTA